MFTLSAWAARAQAPFVGLQLQADGLHAQGTSGLVFRSGESRNKAPGIDCVNNDTTDIYIKATT